MTRLALLTWQGVEDYLRSSKLAVIPIGSTEQHGPNGLIGTDFICAETIARRVGERVGILVAPTISVGMALHHMAFPGTISFQPATLISVIRDYVTSLYAHGFRTFVFVNGHGGNIATGQAAMSSIREGLQDAQMRWLNWWQGPKVSALARELFGEREGSHATPSEISLTMAAYPGTVEHIEGPMDVESCRSRGIPGSERFRELYPDGRIGSDPSMARQEHGEKLLELAVEDIAEEIAGLAAPLSAS